MTLRLYGLLCALLLALTAGLTACGGGQSTPAAVDNTSENAPVADQGAARAVETFWQAKIAGDETRLAAVMCAERESEIEMQSLSFSSVEARLDGMACAVTGVDGDYAVVTCDGQIIATYGTEDREIQLGAARALQQDGEWKWCGEAETAE